MSLKFYFEVTKLLEETFAPVADGDMLDPNPNAKQHDLKVTHSSW